MRRLVHSLLVAVFVVGLGGVVANASLNGTPSITGLSAHVVTRNQDLVISGSGFANDATGNCDTVEGAPTVHFVPLASGQPTLDAPVAGMDSGHCTNTSVHVAVPGGLSGGARVSLTDTSGHTSNANQLLTVVPGASLNPASGGVGTIVTATGANFMPATLAQNPSLRITIGGNHPDCSSSAGVTLTPRSWTDSAVSFDPANHAGLVCFYFPVRVDDNNPGATVDVPVNPGTYAFQPPAPDQSTFAHQVVGNPFHVNGRYMGSGGSISFPGGFNQRGTSWSSSGFDTTVPAGAQPGALTITVDGYGSVPGPTLQLDPKFAAMSPTSGSAGQQVRVTGYNFGTSPGKVRVGSTDVAVTGWADRAVTFAVGGDTDGGVVTVIRPDGAAVDAVSLGVLPRLDKLESNNVVPGSQVVADGVSLGSGTGTATIGGADAQPLLWSRTSVLLQVPATLAPGSYPVTLVNAAGARTNALKLTIIAAPTQAPGAPNKPAVAQPGAVLAPNFDLNHTFTKPIKPPSPVFFNISTDPHTIRAGQTADIVVVLKLNDKPLSGAQVKLEMLFTPGPDYAFTPASGVTDATGTFHSRVKVSKTAGDSVIAATSGAFSDQDHVAGTGADGKTVRVANQANPAAQNSGFVPLAIIGVVAVAMVAAGFYLNIRSTSVS